MERQGSSAAKGPGGFKCQQTDMPAELLEHVYLSVQHASTAAASRGDMCASVQQALEEKTGEPWHVIAGRDFALSIRYRRGTCAIFIRSAPTPMKVLVFQSSRSAASPKAEEVDPADGFESRPLTNLVTNWNVEEDQALRAALGRAATHSDHVAIAKAAKHELHALSRRDGWHVLVGRAKDFDYAVRRPDDSPCSHVSATLGSLRIVAFRHQPGDTAVPQTRPAVAVLAESLQRALPSRRGILGVLYVAALASLSSAMYLQQMGEGGAAPFDCRVLLPVYDRVICSMAVQRHITAAAAPDDAAAREADAGHAQADGGDGAPLWEEPAAEAPPLLELPSPWRFLAGGSGVLTDAQATAIDADAAVAAHTVSRGAALVTLFSLIAAILTRRLMKGKRRPVAAVPRTQSKALAGAAPRAAGSAAAEADRAGGGGAGGTARRAH